MDCVVIIRVVAVADICCRVACVYNVAGVVAVGCFGVLAVVAGCVVVGVAIY